MSSWRIILATLVIFCSGVVLGVLINKKTSRKLENRHPFTGAVSNAPSSASHLVQREFLRRLDRDLNLTPEQRVSIEKILKESQDHTREIREKIAPEMKEEIKKVREQIRLQLTPEQQKKFEEKIKAQRKPDESMEDFRRKFPKDGSRRQRTNAPPTDLIAPTNR
ncbi:MAG: hypothetical protein ABIP71_10505 [Verrucomicrobiota bacterium]